MASDNRVDPPPVPISDLSRLGETLFRQLIITEQDIISGPETPDLSTSGHVRGGILGNIPVAVKEVRRESQEEVVAELTRELQASTFDHRNVCRLIRIIPPREEKDEVVASLVYPYYNGRNLKAWRARRLLNTRAKAIDFMDVLDAGIGIASGLEYLHKQNPMFIHGNLEPKNVVMRDIPDRADKRVVIIDYKHLVLSDPHHRTSSTSGAGAMGYQAPESFRHIFARSEDSDKKWIPTPAADVFGLGAVLAYLLTGTSWTAGQAFMYLEKAAQDWDPTKYMGELFASSEREQGVEYPEMVKDVIYSLMSKVPEERPSAKAAVSLFRTTKNVLSSLRHDPDSTRSPSRAHAKEESDHPRSGPEVRAFFGKPTGSQARTRQPPDRRRRGRPADHHEHGRRDPGWGHHVYRGPSRHGHRRDRYGQREEVPHPSRRHPAQGRDRRAYPPPSGPARPPAACIPQPSSEEPYYDAHQPPPSHHPRSGHREGHPWPHSDEPLMGPTDYVMISYSWNDTAVKDWVQKEFVPELKRHSNGRKIVLDIDFDSLTEQLKDKNRWMGDSILDAGIVVVVGSPEYRRSFESKLGGVGFESQFLLQRLYHHRPDVLVVPPQHEFHPSFPRLLSAGRFGLYMPSDFDKLVRVLRR